MRVPDRATSDEGAWRLLYWWRIPRLCKSKFIFVLACLLAWTSTHCAVLCASPSTDVTSVQTPASEPPCHHHHQNENQGKGGPAPCNHNEVQTAIPQSFERVAVVAGLTVMDLPSALPVPQSHAPMTFSLPHDLPPLPDAGIRLSVVLRI